MSDKTYYTPELSELHEGFELELRDHTIELETWQEITIGENFDLPVMRHLFKSEQQAAYIRVKVLDHDDIIAEGWRKCDWKEMYVQGDFALAIKNLNRVVICPELNSPKWGDLPLLDREWFNGTIRNRSELRLIMKMLGITNAK